VKGGEKGGAEEVRASCPRTCSLLPLPGSIYTSYGCDVTLSVDSVPYLLPRHLLITARNPVFTPTSRSSTASTAGRITRFSAAGWAPPSRNTQWWNEAFGVSVWLQRLAAVGWRLMDGSCRRLSHQHRCLLAVGGCT